MAIEAARKGRNTYYSLELKQEIMNKVLLEGQSQLSISLAYAFSNIGLLPNWIAQFKKNGYSISILEKARRRKPKRTWEEMIELERLQKENERLRTENAYLQKLSELRLSDEALAQERQK